MKIDTRKIIVLFVILLFSNLNYNQQNNNTEEQIKKIINPDLAELIDRVGKRTSNQTVSILNGGDATKTLLSISNAVARMQNLVTTGITNAQNSLTTNITNFQSHAQDAINNLGTPNDTSGLYEILSGLLVTQLIATPISLVTIDDTELLQTSQIGLLQNSIRNTALTTTLTTSSTGQSANDVATFNSAMATAINNINTAISAIQTNIQTANPTNLANAQDALESAIISTSVAIQDLNTVINDDAVITSPYSTDEISTKLGLLLCQLIYMQKLNL